MKANLEVCDLDGSKSFDFFFQKKKKKTVSLPIDAIKRSGDRLGLRFFNNGEPINPVDFSIISPIDEPKPCDVLPDHEVKAVFTGVVEKKTSSISLLSFPHAVYKFQPGVQYSVYFVWHDMKTEMVLLEV